MPPAAVTSREPPASSEQQPLLASERADGLESQAPPLPLPPPTQTAPLPWRKLLVLLGMRFAEPISFSVIFPFVNSMVYEIGATDDKAKVGFYAGIIESLFAVAQCCTILFWGSLSDRIGRKPVLITGLFGVTCSALLFGLSTSFPAAVLARALAGATNGNVAIVKSVVGEITDHTNQARAFSFLPLVWSTGCFIGPLIGGYLSKPAQQYPAVFGPEGPLYFKGLWIAFPYLLPCAVSALLNLSSMLFGVFFLEETLPSKVEAKRRAAEAQQRALAAKRAEQVPLPQPQQQSQPAGPSSYGATAQDSNSVADAVGMRPATVRKTRGRSGAHVLAHVHSWASGFTPSGTPQQSQRNSREPSPSRAPQPEAQEPRSRAAEGEKPLGVWGLVAIQHIRQVLLSYACLAFIAVALDAVLVLYLFEPIELGGLGFDTEHTGLLLSLTGLGGIAVQLVLFPPLQRRVGSLRLFQLSMWAFPISVVLLPVANGIAKAGLAAATGGSGRLEGGGGGGSDQLPPTYQALVWSVTVLSSMIKTLGNMAFGANMILVNQCSWLVMGSALGTLNSLAQLCASLTRAIAPYVSSTLFAISVSKNVLGGQLVWLLLFGAGLVGSLSCLGMRDLEKERLQEAS
ncbi:hypothetical protein ACQY0O_006042 [Thecaphora frezii]